MGKAGRMTQELEAIFRELGFSQYLDAFVEQGFDSWETILDIQESDLDALGVKLGHRRKLQRRIANARGVDPGASLSSPTKGVAEESKQTTVRPDFALVDSGAETPIVTKRKYRRHPKADENGPERPPSAYVLFSNKLREGLKGQTLTFTEIAKLVGENWQSLSPSEREKYESQANAAKEKYHRDMASYKRSGEYHQYMKYLQEFKEKQGKLNQGQETAKRPKLDQTQLTVERGNSRSSAFEACADLGGSSSTASGSSSSSERVRESESGEPPSSRRHESVTSAASVTESRPPSTATKSVTSKPSPRTAYLDHGMSSRGQKRHCRRQSTLRGNVHLAEATQKALPPLSGVLGDSPREYGGPPFGDCRAFGSGFTPANQRHPLPQSSSATFASIPVPSQYPHSSSSSTDAPSDRVAPFGRDRRSSDAPLAIHALLSDQSSTTQRHYKRSPSSLKSVLSPLEMGKPLFGQCQGPREYGFQNSISAFQQMKVEDVADVDVLMMPIDQTADAVESNGKCRFDGMKALLKAGEIVGRNYRDSGAM